MHMGLRSALFGSALPLAGFELGMDFRAGWYRSGAVVTRDPLALPGASFGRDRAKWDNINGLLVQAAAGVPSIVPGVGYVAREAMANYAPNSSWNGMAVGSTASPSMQLNLGTRSGITLAVVATGTENGVDYIDLRASGTANNSASPGNPVYFYPVMSGATNTSQPSVAQGDFWTNSISARLISGSTAGIFSLAFANSYRTDDNTIIYNQGSVNLLNTDPLVTRRSVAQLPAAPANATRAWSHLTYGITDGATIGLTVRLFGFSMNKAPIELPHIATSNGSLSMSADVMRFTQPIVADGDWVILQSATWLRTAAQQPFNGRAWRYHDTAANIERMAVYRNGSTDGNTGGITGLTRIDTDTRTGSGTSPVFTAAGRIITALVKTGSTYKLHARAPDGSVVRSGVWNTAAFPQPMDALNIMSNIEGYHEFFGWRRGTFSDAQITGMLAALA